MLIRFSFVNQYNPLEEDLLYIFTPLEMREFTDGLLCGISSADLMPCAFKCLVTLKPQEDVYKRQPVDSITYGEDDSDDRIRPKLIPSMSRISGYGNLEFKLYNLSNLTEEVSRNQAVSYTHLKRQV